MSQKPTVRLRFQPQAWQNNYAIQVDAEGDDEWDYPLDKFLSEFPRQQSFAENDEARDSLHEADEAPNWVQGWAGPFEVELASGQNPWGDQE